MRRSLLAVATALLMTSCSGGHATAPTDPASTTVARPGTATGARAVVGSSTAGDAARAALRSWQPGFLDGLGTLLTDDFLFEFASDDPSGDPWRTSGWTRELELASAHHLLAGGGPHPPARNVHVTFDGNLVAQPDPRPGKDPGWHRIVRTRVEVTLTEDWSGTPRERIVSGDATFYLVRGDSASIPPELRQLGFGPDSTRWWLQRWDDGTLPTRGLPAAAAARRTSWGRLKVDYL